MQKNKLILYRISNGGLEIVFEKSKDDSKKIAWRLPETELNPFDPPDSKLLQINWIQNYGTKQHYIIIEQNNDLVQAIKQKLIKPIFVKNGFFLRYTDLKSEFLNKKQSFFVKEFADILLERRLLLYL